MIGQAVLLWFSIHVGFCKGKLTYVSHVNCVEKTSMQSMLMLKGSEVMPSRKFLKIMFSKMESRGIFQVQS